MERRSGSSGRRHRDEPSSTQRRSRRRLNNDCEDDVSLYQEVVCEVRVQVETLDSAHSSSSERSREAAKNAATILSEFAKNDELVGVIVDCGAVPSLVRHLQVPPSLGEGHTDSIPYEHEVEKACAHALGLLALKPEHQQLIFDAGAIPYLVGLLKRHKDGVSSQEVNGVIRRAADAISNMAHENSNIKSHIRVDGGIPPLVELLEFSDPRVQRAAAGALRTLAFKSDENKKQIVECNALPTLILMLHSEDMDLHYEAVGVISNLVHSSLIIKKEVLAAGALQPVIGLLRSSCTDAQREAALLLGQFATADSDCKAHIVQRGAVPLLIEMLQSPDIQVKEMSAFALGRLSQDNHNQAGIAHCGGISPLLKLLESRNGSVQHNAAFTLYELADNEDNIPDLVKEGLVQKLQDGGFINQGTRVCVAKTLIRLEDKICGRVLSHLLYMMRVGEKNIQRQVALALAHLCSPDEHKNIFIDKNGLMLLLELLGSTDPKNQRNSSIALCRLANKANSLSPVEESPSSTVQVHLGEQYVNNPNLSDVTFLVEGKRFYAHRICLLASSDAFRAMFRGGYREQDGKDIEIPNIRWDVFELMMRYTYTGSVEVNLDIAQDLLRAADQYLLDGLKLLCENTIAKCISVENLCSVYELSEAFNAVSLRNACILFILENYDKLRIRPWYSEMIQLILPDILGYFVRLLTKPVRDDVSCASSFPTDHLPN